MTFSEFERTDTESKRAGESSFRFLDRSARPEIARVRTFLSEAMNKVPATDRAELWARIRSGNETNFRSATFEVAIHEALTRLGYQLTCHPDPGTGVAKRPDFLVTAPDGQEFFLEAVLASEQDGKILAAEAMKEVALGYVNERPHNAFSVAIESEGDPSTQPSGKRLARDIHAWLDTLDADPLRNQLIAHGLDAMPTMTWSHESWEVRLRAIPTSIERRGTFERLIGVFENAGGWVNTWEPLRDAVKRKANRYGALTKPLVLAVNVDIFNLDEIDEVQALYGEEVWVEAIGHPEQCGLRHRPNGAWYGPHGPQNRRVSAVWFFNDLSPYTLANRKCSMYVNPWANYAPPERLLCFPTSRIEEGRLVRVPGMDLGTIFGLLWSNLTGHLNGWIIGNPPIFNAC